MNKQNLPQRYVIVHLLEKVAVGHQFKPEDYPLHITIVPSFKLKMFDKSLMHKLRRIALQIGEVKTIAMKDEYFGPRNDVAVTPLVLKKSLQHLHHRIAKEVAEIGAIFDEPDYMFENYRPHASVQQKSRIYENDKVVINSITIIDKRPGKNPNLRKVLATIEF